jgi:hypothetical protein
MSAETILYPGLKVLQASGAVAVRILRANGFSMLGRGGFSDGSTTWKIALADALEEPVDAATAQRACDVLRENGFGYVEIVSIAVPS